MFNINKYNKEIEGIKKLRNAHVGLSMEKQVMVKNKILNEIARLPIENTSSGFWVKYKLKHLQYVLVFGLGVAIFGGTAYASSMALPGEILYPVKRVTEKLQLNVAVSEESKANLQAKFAEKRLKELGEIQKQKKLNMQDDESKLSTSTQPVLVSTTTPALEKPEVKIRAVKFKESKVEKDAKLEAQVEVKEALINLRKLQKKMSEQGQEARAKALGENILKLKNKAIEKDIKEDEEEIGERKEQNNFMKFEQETKLEIKERD